MTGRSGRVSTVLVGMTALCIVLVLWLWTRPIKDAQAKQSASSAEKLKEQLQPELPASLSGYRPVEAARGDFTDVATPVREPQTLTISCPKVEIAPVIDGVGTDEVWKQAASIKTLDALSQREITLSCARTDTHIYFKATYPDVNASVTHKSYKWDPELKIYKQYTDREDVFVLKWAMDAKDSKIALSDAVPHKADVWFWKACRTDPAGFADDKYQLLLGKMDKKQLALKISNQGKADTFLIRSGDSGQSAYSEQVPVGYKGDFVKRYNSRQPYGSRGDIRAKGSWANGVWTVEFARLLDTSDPVNDEIFTVGGEYVFGVSCYEIAGDSVHPEFTQPLYRHGDIYDKIVLHIGD